MAIFTNDVIRDAALDKLITDATVVHLIETYSEVFATVVADSMGNYTPSISKTDNGADGRKAVLALENTVPITASGPVNLNFIAVCSGSVVLHLAPSNGKSFDDGDFANIPAVDLLILGDTTEV